jgi:hypothetical protein
MQQFHASQHARRRSAADKVKGWRRVDREVYQN